MSFHGLDGFDELEKELRLYIQQASPEKAAEIVKAGADEFIKDLKSMPRPRSRIGGGHTHLLDSFASKRDGKDWLVGWGVYYGRFVEKGTRKMRARPHVIPLWEQHKEKYQQTMNNKFLEVR